MPRAGGNSFRILHPDPFDISRAPQVQMEISFAVEFSSRGQAFQFEKNLKLFPQVRFTRFNKNKTYTVSWTMTLIQSHILLKTLRSWPELSRQMSEGLKGYVHPPIWLLQGRGRSRYRWAKKTQLMGVLNVTPDSFSDGGQYLDPSTALERALQMQEEGADWVDVGGESTRPGAKALTAGEEKKRILPVLKACAKALRVPVSVDTYKSEVAEAAVGEGAQMVNDIGALGLDPRIGKTLARLKVPVVLMHMKGKPRTMQKNPRYGDLMGELIGFFRGRLDFARDCGISEDRLLVDPGFGFGKTPWHNIEMIRRLWELKVLGKPIVLGPSRKSTLGLLLGGAPPGERVDATAAAVTAAILKGADFVRVHDVKAMASVVKIADAIRYDRGLTTP